MDSEFVHPLIKNLPIIFSFIFIFLVLFILYTIEDILFIKEYISIDVIKYVLSFNNILAFGFHAGFFNTIYNNLYLYIFKLSYIQPNKFLDKGLFEYIGPFGIYKYFYNLKILFPYIYPVFFTISIFIMFLFIIIFCSLIFFFYFQLIIILINNIGLIPILLLYFIY